MVINYAFNAAFGLVFDTNTAYFIAFSVMGLFITFLYPIVFCKKSRYKLGWALAAVILLVPIVIVVFN